MRFMSCCMLRPSANTVRLTVEETLQKRVHACKVFVVGSQRRRVRNWVVFAKRRRRSSKRQHDVLDAFDGEEELPNDEKFKEWKGKKMNGELGLQRA
uniref:Uncharacterized protein n=1 Tax=Oryza rufipogon TaxID=4529 RepID=A0A0E0PDV3_ORYRU